MHTAPSTSSSLRLPPAPPTCTPFVIRDNTELGKVIDGKYRLTGLIAKGGMGRVFRAEHLTLGRTVALKVLVTGESEEEDAEFRGRFLREVTACARLRHPNTIQILDHGTVGPGLLYMAMEWVDGRTLHQAIRADGPMRGDRIAQIVRQVCLSLREAHEAGMVHRDVKPANIMLMDTGDGADFVKLLDFGLVTGLEFNDRISGPDGVVGSPTFMSPEQISGQLTDARSDIYSLGVVMYAALSGRVPFGGSDAIATMSGHLNVAPPPLNPTLPGLQDYPGLAAIALRCLAKNPQDRYADVDALLADLRAALTSPAPLAETAVEALAPSAPTTPAASNTWQLLGWASLLGVASYAAMLGATVFSGLSALG